MSDYKYKQITVYFSEDNEQELRAYNMLAAFNRKKAKFITVVMNFICAKYGLTDVNQLTKAKINYILEDLLLPESNDILKLLTSLSENSVSIPTQNMEKQVVQIEQPVTTRNSPINPKPTLGITLDKDPVSNELLNEDGFSEENEFPEEVDDVLDDEARQNLLDALSQFNVF